jgi:hypothetical protein
LGGAKNNLPAGPTVAAGAQDASEVSVRSKSILMTGVLVIVSLTPLAAQIQSAPPQSAPEDEQVMRAEKEQAKRRNKERQVSLKRDTDKLFNLATELKRYVDQSNENVLSVDVVRKAEEIEKLAHSVRDKMKGY